MLRDVLLRRSDGSQALATSESTVEARTGGEEAAVKEWSPTYVLRSKQLPRMGGGLGRV